jgi:GNAT superfamily N-acetyltransferase
MARPDVSGQASFEQRAEEDHAPMTKVSHIEFSFERPVGVADLRPLLHQAEWAARRADDALSRLLDQSPVKLGGWHQGRLIAFARALTDDICRALIDDVVVDAAYRGQGVGSELMRRMVRRLGHVEEMLLHCQPEMATFYERFGFRQNLICMVREQGEAHRSSAKSRRLAD